MLQHKNKCEGLNLSRSGHIFLTQCNHLVISSINKMGKEAICNIQNVNEPKRNDWKSH